MYWPKRIFGVRVGGEGGVERILTCGVSGGLSVFRKRWRLGTDHGLLSDFQGPGFRVRGIWDFIVQGSMHKRMGISQNRGTPFIPPIE